MIVSCGTPYDGGGWSPYNSLYEMNVNLDDVMCDIDNDDQAHNRVLCQMEQKYYAAKYIMCTFSLDS